MLVKVMAAAIYSRKGHAAGMYCYCCAAHQQGPEPGIRGAAGDSGSARSACRAGAGDLNSSLDEYRPVVLYAGKTAGLSPGSGLERFFSATWTGRCYARRAASRAAPGMPVWLGWSVRSRVHWLFVWVVAGAAGCFFTLDLVGLPLKVSGGSGTIRVRGLPETAVDALYSHVYLLRSVPSDGTGSRFIQFAP